MRDIATLLSLAIAALLMGCSSVPLGRVDVVDAAVGEFVIPGECNFEIGIEFVQANSVVASGRLSPGSGEFDDSGINYRAPLRIHLWVVRATTGCPPELQQGRHYYWPSANSMGTLQLQPNRRRYRVDVRDFKPLQITPGSSHKN